MVKPYTNLYIAILLTLVILGCMPEMDFIIKSGTHDWLYPSCREFSGQCDPLTLVVGSGFTSLMASALIGVIVLQIQAVAYATRRNR